jgi:acyl-CoA thioesterase-1
MRVACLVLVSLLLAAPGCGPADDAGPPAREAREREEGNRPESAAAPSAAAAGGPRVVFVGTSLTAGFGLMTPEEAFSTRLQEMADSAGLPARMVNAGVSGETSAGGLRRIGWVLGDTVDVLVLELGANDGLRGLPTEALKENLAAIIDSTRAHWPDARIVVVGMEAPPNLGSRYTQAFRAVFRDVARSQGAELVPFLLEGVGGVRELNQNDGIHPTAEGHRTMARTIWPVLEPLLRDAAVPSR